MYNNRGGRGDGGGRGGRGGRGDKQDRPYQRSYVGGVGKRGREEEGPPKPSAQHILVAKLLGLCDRNTVSSPENCVSDLG
jgi:nuclear cap-binding protein subunit 1